MTDQREKWDQRYRQAERAADPAEVLSRNLHLLPPHGRALELACGLGSNARLLAAQGLETHAWDLSPVAIGRLEEDARKEGLAIHAKALNVLTTPPAPESFDVIVVSRFLERPLVPALIAALRPRGLLFYQTFTRARVTGRGPDDDSFRLERNELLRLFSPLTLVYYREEDLLGDTGRGLRDNALLIGQKV